MLRIVSALIEKTLNWIISSFGEKLIRREQKKYRAATRSYMLAKADLESLQIRRSQVRSNNEGRRRAALIAYYSARRDLLEAAVDLLLKADDVAYSGITNIKSQISTKNVQFRQDIWRDFKNATSRMHASVGDSKFLRNQIKKQISVAKAELNHLHDGSTHKKLGSRKAILALLSDRAKEVRKEFSTDKDIPILELGNVAFDMDENASCCKIKISSLMAYCFSCGKERDDARTQKWSRARTKKQFELLPGLSCCTECNAPLAEEFIFCYNCGEKVDYMGLEKLVNL